MGEFEMATGNEHHVNKLKIFLVVLVATIVIVSEITMFIFGKSRSRVIGVDFSSTNVESDIDWKYKFLKKEISDYIFELSTGAQVKPNLSVSILMVENPEFDPEAMHRNDNGTIDVGLFQPNDYYFWTTFKDNYWKFDNIELDPFNWKHNTYIAIHHIQWLQSQLKVEDDVIMAYNCGIGAVMSGNIPDSTRVYLAKVKNNMALLDSLDQVEN